jgi:NitT/TauT family transport system ATP-binding protein
MGAPGPEIELRAVSKWFPEAKGGRLYVLQDLSLTIDAEAAGGIVVVLGPSGCGKTTLLKLISGLLLPDSGSILVDREPVTGPGPNSATVPQAYTCFPWLSVLGNVEFGLALENMPRDERRRVALNYLVRVGLAERANARPSQLSNGMQQRVAIARTLAMRRSVVLMDEPFGALDAQTRAEMQNLVLELWSAESSLIVFVTHDITEALYLADRIILFSSRPARVIADLRVPFPRPRVPALQHDAQFLRYAGELREALRAGSEPARRERGAMRV